MPKKIEISHRTIVFTALFILSLWLLFLIRQILLGIFISLILMSALNPSVKKLESFHLPRWLAILIIYIIALATIILGVSGIIPPLVEQTSNLISSLPQLLAQFKVLGIDEKLIASQFSQFTSIPSNLIKFVMGLFSNIVAVFGIAVITFYLLLERKNLDKYLTLFFGVDKEKEIEKVVDQIEVRLGGWIRGQLFLMTFIGLLSYIGFRFIGLNFALPLAILSFILEIVPNVGPTVAAIPAILIGITVSPIHALAAAGWCFLIQQVENTILVPRVMKQVAGVNPLISLISLAVGFKLAGVGGAILAIPTFMVIEVIASEISSSKRFNQISYQEASPSAPVARVSRSTKGS
jgi:predicted PurR-regulated permease PerM